MFNLAINNMWDEGVWFYQSALNYYLAFVIYIYVFFPYDSDAGRARLNIARREREREREHKNIKT